MLAFLTFEYADEFADVTVASSDCAGYADSDSTG